MRSGIYVFKIVTIYISSYQVGKVPRSLLTLLVRIRDGRESSFLTILLYFESSKTHTSYSNTQKIFMDIFVPVVVKKNHPTQEKQRNTFRRLNVTFVACGNILNECLEGEDVPDANWFCSYSCQKLDDVA